MPGRLGGHPLRSAGMAVLSVPLTMTAVVTAQAAGSAAAAPSLPAAALAVQAETATTPVLHWGRCAGAPSRFQCARATVPLDYGHATAGTITLGVVRLPAADRAHRIGSLFVNPGGPGASGVQFVLDDGVSLAAGTEGRFDIVGFDPRGVTSSNPVRCFRSNDQQGAFLASQPAFPYRLAQERPYFDAWTGVGDRCGRLSPRVLPHLSTADVARDMDLLRRAVGDPRMTYLGFSYGSYLGTTYANLFPGRVRALVVDGVLDPRTWSGRSNLRYDQVGADQTLAQLLRLCAAAGPRHCSFAQGGDPTVRFARLAAQLRRHPVTLAGGDRVTYDAMVATVLGGLYSTTIWPDVAGYLQGLATAAGAAEAGGSQAAAAADRLAQAAQTVQATLAGPAARAPAYDAPAYDTPAYDTPAYDNGLDAYLGNRCADSTLPRSFRTWQLVGSATARASLFGPAWWWSDAACAAMTTNADRYAGPWTARTSAPVLVVGNRYDPATAYGGAKAVAALLPRSRLLTYAGWGHTAYGKPCVTPFVDAYLLRGSLPPAGTVCPAEPNPFLGATDRALAALVPPVGRPTR